MSIGHRMLLAATLASIGGFGAADPYRPPRYPQNVEGGWSGRVTGRHLVAQHVISGKPWKRGKPVRIRRAEYFRRRRRTAQDRLAAIRMYQAQGAPEMVALVKRRG